MSQQNSQYVDRKMAEQSYRPKAGSMSPGLLRAREPYRIRNALTGLILGGFAVGIWAYSISAVKQDVFDDVDEEARAMARSGTSAEVLSVKAEKKAMEAAAAAAATPGGTGTESKTLPATASTPTTGSPQPAAPSRGILRYLWGSAPVDGAEKVSKS